MPLGAAIDDDQVEHLVPRTKSDAAGRGSGATAPSRRRAGTAARSGRGRKRPRHLRAAEGAVGQQTAVFAGERHARSDALVDDV